MLHDVGKRVVLMLMLSYILGFRSPKNLTDMFASVRVRCWFVAMMRAGELAVSMVSWRADSEQV